MPISQRCHRCRVGPCGPQCLEQPLLHVAPLCVQVWLSRAPDAHPAHRRPSLPTPSQMSVCSLISSIKARCGAQSVRPTAGGTLCVCIVWLQAGPPLLTWWITSSRCVCSGSLGMTPRIYRHYVTHATTPRPSGTGCAGANTTRSERLSNDYADNLAHNLASTGEPLRGLWRGGGPSNTCGTASGQRTPARSLLMSVCDHFLISPQIMINHEIFQLFPESVRTYPTEGKSVKTPNISQKAARDTPLT